MVYHACCCCSSSFLCYWPIQERGQRNVPQVHGVSDQAILLDGKQPECKTMAINNSTAFSTCQCSHHVLCLLESQATITTFTALPELLLVLSLCWVEHKHQRLVFMRGSFTWWMESFQWPNCIGQGIDPYDKSSSLYMTSGFYAVARLFEACVNVQVLVYSSSQYFFLNTQQMYW